MAGPQPVLELCAGAYRVQQMSGSLVIFAEGVHPSSGFNSFLSCETANADLPVFALWHVLPSGPVLQVSTPFSVWTAFQTLRTVSRALIKDANGTHEILVDQAAESTMAHHGARRPAPNGSSAEAGRQGLDAERREATHG